MNSSNSSTFSGSGASWTRKSDGVPVIREMLRHRLVGEQHELLDQAMGDVALGGEDRRHAAGLVEHQLVLGQVEVDRAAAAPARRSASSNSSPISSNIGTSAA